MRVIFVLLTVYLGSSVVQSQTTPVRSESPRKVVVATVMLNYFKPWPGLEKRLATLDSLVDEAAAAAERKYPGEGLDMVVLPEEAVTCGMGTTPETRSLPLGGAWLDRKGAAARRHNPGAVARHRRQRLLPVRLHLGMVHSRQRTAGLPARRTRVRAAQRHRHLCDHDQ